MICFKKTLTFRKVNVHIVYPRIFQKQNERNNKWRRKTHFEPFYLHDRKLNVQFSERKRVLIIRRAGQMFTKSIIFENF